MLATSELPSIRDIAETIIFEACGGQIILFSLPKSDTWEKWRDILFEAFKNRLNELGEEPPFDIMAPAGDLPLEKQIADYLGLPKADFESILTTRHSGLPLLIEIPCCGDSSVEWLRFVEKSARFFRVGDHEYRPRMVCLFLLAPSTLPPVKPNVGLRQYAFWNPLRWEEIRLLVSDSIKERENPLARAWKVSTYAGAACFDPFIATRLASSQPTSIEEVRRKIAGCCKERPGDEVTHEDTGRFYRETRWDVPTGLVKRWLSGSLIGTTLDRGAALSLANVVKDDVDKHLAHAIWREQIAGLFPLFMEITYYVSEALTRACGDKWKEYLEYGNGEGTTEPGDILYIFSKYHLGRLPDAIYQLLAQLRIVRNKLAHLEPVELREVQQIYNQFTRAVQ